MDVGNSGPGKRWAWGLGSLAARISEDLLKLRLVKGGNHPFPEKKGRSTKQMTFIETFFETDDFY